MENTLFNLSFLINIILFIITFVSSYFVNDFNGSGRLLFGIRIPKEYTKDTRILELKNKYKVNITIGSIAIFILSFIIIAPFNYTISTIFSVFGVLICSAIFYLTSYKKLLNIKTSENWHSLSSQKVYVSLESTRETNLVNLYWYIIPIFIGIGSLILTLLYINKLPTQVPLHFDITGTADRVGSGADLSTKLQVLLLPILSIFTTAIIFFSTKNHNKSAERINGGKISEVKAKNGIYKKNLFQLNIVLSLIVSGILLYFNLITLGLLAVNSTLMIASSVLPILLLIITLPIFISNNSKKVNDLGIDENEKDIYIDDDNPYKLGGLFYYNKNNPSTWIPKRMGIGYTVNCATLGGKLFWGFIVLLILFAILVSK